MERTFFTMGALFAGLAVAAGAFGAHALRDRLEPDMLAIFETGARYQMYHAMALMMLGVISTRVENIWIKFSGLSFVLGTVLFSGSLYLLTLYEQKVFGFVTPVGGVFLILGWLFLVVSVLQVF